jgi:hypothetical protein
MLITIRRLCATATVLGAVAAAFEELDPSLWLKGVFVIDRPAGARSFGGCATAEGALWLSADGLLIASCCRRSEAIRADAATWILVKVIARAARAIASFVVLFEIATSRRMLFLPIPCSPGRKCKVEAKSQALETKGP